MSIASIYKLSVFGRIQGHHTPEIVVPLMKKINEKTGKNMLPRTIQSHQIEIPSNRISTISNLGFITQDQTHSIAILDNRVDATYNKSRKEEVAQEDFYSFAVKALEVILEQFGISANGLAAHSQYVCELGNGVTINKKGKELLRNAAYYDHKDYVEWSLHTNAVDTVKINESTEPINVVTKISSGRDISGTKALIIYHIDINTFSQNSKFRFGKNSLAPFVEGIIPIASHIVEDIERLISDD